MRTIFRNAAVAATAAALWVSMGAGAIRAQTAPQAGDLIKLQDDGDLDTQVDSALYYYGSDGQRYVFPNDRVYFTWYTDFSTVKIVSPETMASIPIGGNVTYRPGSRMIKITSDPKTYAVAKNGILRWVQTEAIATALYGSDWNTKIDDVSDAFFVNYRQGAAIESTDDLYTASGALAMSPTIEEDLLLTDPSSPTHVDIREAGFTPNARTVSAGTAITWINLHEDAAMVASNDHPTHTLLEGLESATLELGQMYRFTFDEAGSWGYHNHWNPEETGTINVP
jgi:plastocyanin